MRIQPSMSRSEILLECSFPFGRELPEGAGQAGDRQAADYGSGFHELMAANLGPPRLLKKITPKTVAGKWEIDDPDELGAHVKASVATLREWLRKNPFAIDWGKHPMQIERAVALRPLMSARYIALSNAEHVYEECKDDEQPGTSDLTILPPGRDPTLLVLDHKTGDHEDFSEPATKAQLLSLAAATMRITRARRAVVAVLHARRRGLPKVYADLVTLGDLKEHEAKIARGLARVGDGSMKPGPWCKYCPARDICPTRDAELLERSGNVLEGLVAAGGLLAGDTTAELVTMPPGKIARERKLGALYVVLQQAEKLAARIRDEIRKEIVAEKGMLLPETPDGRILTIRTITKETLSKASVVRALGKLQGERMIAKLRKMGAVESNSYDQLHLEENDKAGR